MKTQEEKIEEVVSKFDFDWLHKFINSDLYSEKNWLKGKSVEQLEDKAREAIRFSFKENLEECCLDGFLVIRKTNNGSDMINLCFSVGHVISSFKNDTCPYLGDNICIFGHNCYAKNAFELCEEYNKRSYERKELEERSKKFEKEFNMRMTLIFTGEKDGTDW